MDQLFREASGSTLDKISEIEAKYVPKVKKSTVRKVVNQTPRPTLSTQPLETSPTAPPPKPQKTTPKKGQAHETAAAALSPKASPKHQLASPKQASPGGSVDSRSPGGKQEEGSPVLAPPKKATVMTVFESEEYSVPSETVNTAHNPNLTFKSI